MTRSVAPRPLILLGLAIIVIMNAWLFGGRLTAWVADGSGRVLAPVVGRMAHLRALVTTTLARGDLAVQNVALQDEITRVRAQLAGQEELQRQVRFYRDAAGIRERTGTDPIAAGIFAYPQSGGVKQVIINRGRAEWVVVGDVVITPSGTLVGAVATLFEHHAVVRTIGDVALDVTVRVLGTEVSGLLRTAVDGSVMMDLVQKNETVTEGSVIVTSGDDRYPAGLVVGTVRSVDNDAATLFKIVRIAPAVSENISGDVIVVKP
jgi:rod shape-determining protein MreC